MKSLSCIATTIDESFSEFISITSNHIKPKHIKKLKKIHKLINKVFIFTVESFYSQCSQEEKSEYDSWRHPGGEGYRNKVS